MAWNFHVGQKVVCIEDGWTFLEGTESNPLENGAVYTVTGLDFDKYGDSPFGYGDVVVLNLAEVSNPYGFGHDGFDARRFRPLEERKTDISIFTAMLMPKKEGVPA